MESRIDLAADLNEEDDEGFGWSTLSEARDPGKVRPGVMLVAGNRQARAVVRVVAIDDDGQMHFTVPPVSPSATYRLDARTSEAARQDAAHQRRHTQGYDEFPTEQRVPPNDQPVPIIIPMSAADPGWRRELAWRTPISTRSRSTCRASIIGSRESVTNAGSVTFR